MKKTKYIIVLFVMLLCMPLSICKAADTYVTSVINSNGSVAKIGDYTDYASAKNAAIDYESDSSSVSVVYRNDKIVYAEYAIIRFNGGSVVNIYPNTTTTTAYTSIHSSYGTEAAFIDYDASSNRSKIKISGYAGYVSSDTLEVVPISSITSNSIKIVATISINVRTGPGTSYDTIGAVSQGQIYSYSQKKNDGLYTWYNINYNGTSAWIASADSTWTTEVVASNLETYYEHYSTDNVIHYYKYASGQSYTNLGKSPSYLKRGTNYYSFDGNYFYTDLINMLDDYKENTTAKAINTSSPFYSYYMYLPNHSKTKYTADDFNQIIISKGYNSKNDSAMYGEGASFIASQDKYGVNAMLTFAAALNESASGTSWIAKNKNNLFGHGAYDSCPAECATTYATIADGVLAHARMTGQGYNDPSDWRFYGSHYGNKASGMNVKYATDPYWGEKAASNAFNNDKKFGQQDFNSNTIGVKTTINSVPVRKEPKESSSVIYNLKNNSYNVEKIPLIVFDKVTANGYEWYKVYTDVALDDNQNKTNGDYSFEKSFGYVRVDYLDVENSQPTISAIDLEFKINSEYNLLKGVSASDKEDGDLTRKIEYTDNVDITKPGTYQVTYTVEDESRFSVSKTVNVIITGVPDPVITATDIEVSQYTGFNAKDYATANDVVDGNITDKIEVLKDNVNINVVGEYEVTYAVTNSYKTTVTKTIKVTVVENAKPVINAEDKEILLNSDFDNMKGVTATDREDGNITSNIVIESDNVDTKKVGKYQITYNVTDKANQTVTRTININVIEDMLEKKDSLFYFNYLKENNNKLEIKGYHAIKGINNDLATPLTYKLVYENIVTGNTYSQDLTRITDKTEMTRPVYSNDGYDYTYSWFKGNVEIKDIPDGDYIIYVVTESNKYYAKTIISNKVLKEQVSEYVDNKTLTTRNNYRDNNIPLELIIRTDKIGNKTSDSVYNIFNQFRTFKFENGKLHIKGTSYSIGMNLDTKQNVERKIIFENIDNFTKYEYDLGSITNGMYAVGTTLNDGLSKTRAWFDTSIDLINIPKGKYAIYILTKSNISDYGELTELLFRSLDDVILEKNNKKYTFKVNEQLRYRVEMSVE